MAGVISIKGGAGLAEAAAIAAVISYQLEQEAQERARPPRRAVPSAWVRSGRPELYRTSLRVPIPLDRAGSE
jgi:hypothetical protein